jgi:hypothetical protein
MMMITCLMGLVVLWSFAAVAAVAGNEPRLNCDATSRARPWRAMAQGVRGEVDLIFITSYLTVGWGSHSVPARMAAPC